MIVEWLIGIGSGIATWFTGLFPQGDVAEFITTLDDKLNAIFAGMSGVGVWADWGYMITVVGVVVLLWSIGLGVRAVLTIWKLVPVVGGG